LITIDQEVVEIVLPWITKAELDKIIEWWKATIKQRKDEIKRAEKEWTTWWIDVSVQAGISAKLSLAIGGLEKNLEILESYKTIPEDINDLINSKNKYLEQILCNIESISELLGWRISKNGKRFKAWVKTYLLIKAILKSWQIIIDVFIDFEQECHECKNERQDSLESLFQIGILMPKIPIIKFPRWPDIEIDLHNIRAWLNIGVPEFQISTKPILLPTLPNLYLPNKPDINLSAYLDINFPILLNLPTLPEIVIPTLPDLPNLPSIELPDLPPPIKLPAIPSWITAVLNILDLIFKAMCILKSLPIHPEWRAWDQIAFLTERWWYLWSDFFEITLPEFDLGAFDAIRVSTYVNLELEVDFIVEFARAIADPINSLSNDFINIFNIRAADLDFRHLVPGSIDIGVDAQVWAWAEVWYNLNNALDKTIKKWMIDLAKMTLEWSKDELTSDEFKKLIDESLLSHRVVGDPKFDKLRELWINFDKNNYSKEDSLINELIENNNKKFEVVKDILNTEILETKELRKRINNIWNSPIITKVAYNNNDKFDLYNKSLSKYNDRFIQSAKNLINPSNPIESEIKNNWKKLINSVKTPLSSFNNSSQNKSDKLLSLTKAKKSFIPKSIPVASNQWSNQTSCQKQATSDYKYNYKWLYVLDKYWNKNYSYNLIDNTDELNWEEQTSFIDFDIDGDDDVLYFVNGQLFLKENLKNPYSGINVISLILKNNATKFFDWKNNFYWAVNWVYEWLSEVWNINLLFSSHSNEEINNYRVKVSENKLGFKNIIIDGISSIDEVTKNPKENDDNEWKLYITRKNLGYIENIRFWTDNELVVKDLTDLNSLISQWEKVNILEWTTVYAGKEKVNITYSLNWTWTINPLSVDAYNNIELLNDININSITKPLYVEINDSFITLSWSSIYSYKNLPLLPWSKITWTKGIYDIKYYSWSELDLDLSDTYSWELQDLWLKSSDYFVRKNIDNGYYKATVNVFNENIEWTLSEEILLSPQIESDDQIPEFFTSTIQLPLEWWDYDITDLIYENWWIENINKVLSIVDMDLSNGSDSSDVSIDWSNDRVVLQFWNFLVEHKREIWITIVDNNNNKWYYRVNLDVWCNWYECYEASKVLCTNNPWIINAQYTIWNPTQSTEWKNQSTWQTSCYYECDIWYSWDNCEIIEDPSCAPIPSFLTDINSIITEWVVSKPNTLWRHIDSWQTWCYYECSNSYSWEFCEVTPLVIPWDDTTSVSNFFNEVKNELNDLND